MIDIQHCIKELGYFYRIDNLLLSKHKTCQIIINNSLPINIEVSASNEWLFLYWDLPTQLQIESLEFYQKLLLANFFGKKTNGASFAIKPHNDQLVFNQRIDMEQLEQEKLTTIFEQFAETVIDWSKELPSFDVQVPTDNVGETQESQENRSSTTQKTPNATVNEMETTRSSEKVTIPNIDSCLGLAVRTKDGEWVAGHVVVSKANQEFNYENIKANTEEVVAAMKEHLGSSEISAVFAFGSSNWENEYKFDLSKIINFSDDVDLDFHAHNETLDVTLDGDTITVEDHKKKNADADANIETVKV